MAAASVLSPCRAIRLCSDREETVKSLWAGFLFWEKLAERVAEIRLEDTEQILTGVPHASGHASGSEKPEHPYRG